MSTVCIPINGNVTEVVVDTEPDRTIVTVQGPGGSTHTQVIEAYRWSTVDVVDKVVVLEVEDDRSLGDIQDFLTEFGERIRDAGGVCVVALGPGWTATAETIVDFQRMLYEHAEPAERVSPEGHVSDSREAPVETERTNPDTDTTNGENGEQGGDDGRHEADQPVDTGSVPNETVDESGRETDYGAQQRTGDPDADGGTERTS